MAVGDASHDRGKRLVRLLLLLLRGPILRIAILRELGGFYGASPEAAVRRDLQTLAGALPPGARLVYRKRHSEVALEGLGTLIPPVSRGAGLGSDTDGVVTLDPADAAALQTLLARLRGGTTKPEPGVMRVEIELASNFAEHAAIVSALEQALKEGRSLQFIYQAAGKEARRHDRVIPRQIVLRDGHLYLDAYDGQQQRDREYRVDRIQQGTIVQLPFYGEQVAPPGRVRVRVRLLPPLTSADVSKRLQQQQIVERLDDGSVIVEGLARTLFDAQRLVLGYGALAEALDPPELRARVAEESRVMAAKYGAAPNRSGAPLIN
jgi:predicted DNA-binding transcriptional regulator YafY